MVYRRRGSSRYWTTVPAKTPGEYVHLPTRTRDEATAKAMAAMWTLIGGAGKRWTDLTDAVLDKRCTLPRLYDHYIAGSLDQLRAELSDRDLAPGVQAWDKQLEDQYRGHTPRKYRHHVASLFPRDGKTYRALSRSELLAPGFIAGKLATVGKSRTNRRRHHECWLSACEYLTEHGYLAANPLRSVKKPKPDTPDVPHIRRYADVLRLLHAFPPGAHRAAAALREGAGMELQSVLAMRSRDVADIEDRIVWAHGEKNRYRDRQARVDPECFEIFLEYYRAGRWLPDAPLFPFTDDHHREVHNAAVATAIEAGADIPAVKYTPHAARHTFAIRWLQRGEEPGLIANNLGLADASLVLRRYGKYRPTIIDIKRAGMKAQGEK